LPPAIACSPSCSCALIRNGPVALDSIRQPVCPFNPLVGNQYSPFSGSNVQICPDRGLKVSGTAKTISAPLIGFSKSVTCQAICTSPPGVTKKGRPSSWIGTDGSGTSTSTLSGGATAGGCSGGSASSGGGVMVPWGDSALNLSAGPSSPGVGVSRRTGSRPPAAKAGIAAEKFGQSMHVTTRTQSSRKPKNGDRRIPRTRGLWFPAGRRLGILMDVLLEVRRSEPNGSEAIIQL
jgi:hypothetical protein